MSSRWGDDLLHRRHGGWGQKLPFLIRLMAVSCHIGRVEIVVKLGIFVFFWIFNWTEIRSKRIQITLIELWSLISFELRHLYSLKVSQNAKFGCSFFSVENKNKIHVRLQFQQFEYDMSRTIVYGRPLIFILDRENDIVVVRLALFTSRFFPLPSRTNQRNVNLTSVVEFLLWA